MRPGARPASACNSFAHTHTAHEEKRKAQEGVMRVLETVGGLRFAQPDHHDGPGHGCVYWKPPRMGTSRQIKDIRGRGRELCLRALFPHAHSAAIGRPSASRRRTNIVSGRVASFAVGPRCSADQEASLAPARHRSTFPLVSTPVPCRAVPCRAVHADRALSKSDMAHAVNTIESDLARSSAH